jgi:hypothetical protein
MIKRIAVISVLNLAVCSAAFAQGSNSVVASAPSIVGSAPTITASLPAAPLPPALPPVPPAPPYPTPVVDPTIIVVPAVSIVASDTTGKFLSLSTRAYVGSGNAVCIVGFVVGSGGRHVLIRAVGPALKKFGIDDFLKKPKAELFDKDGKLLATGTAWSAMSPTDKSGLTALFTATGAFSFDGFSDDAAMHLKLPGGNYTLVISSADGSSGVVMGEVYESPTYATYVVP